jgi:hypothetical protein
MDNRQKGKTSLRKDDLHLFLRSDCDVSLYRKKSKSARNKEGVNPRFKIDPVLEEDPLDISKKMRSIVLALCVVGASAFAPVRRVSM